MKINWKKHGSKLIIGLLTILLAASTLINLNLKDYKNAQEETNERLWDDAVVRGFNLPLEDIAYLTDRLDVEETMEINLVVERLEQTARNLEQASMSFNQMEPYFAHQDSASTRVMTNLMRDYQQYVQQDMMQPLQSKHNLGYKSVTLLLEDLDRLKEDLVYLRSVMKDQSITEDKPADIQQTWKKTIRKMVDRNPDHAFHQQIKEKYSWI
ncbi:hypothetical protein M3231_00265 [Neobacillus mesonae]|nr:hypothetical protein [Neobacillus mesonae]